MDENAAVQDDNSGDQGSNRVKDSGVADVSAALIEKLDRLERLVQSRTDQAESRDKALQDKLSKLEEAYKASGGQISKAAYDAAKQRIEADALIEQVGKGVSDSGESIEDIKRRVWESEQEIYKAAHNIAIMGDDPEVAMLDNKNPDPQKYLSSVQRAVNAKLERLGLAPVEFESEPLDNKADQEESRPARASLAPGAGGGGGSAANTMSGETNPDVLISEGLRQRRRKR